MAASRGAWLPPLLFGGVLAVLIAAVYPLAGQPLTALPFLLVGYFVVLTIAGALLSPAEPTGAQAVRTAMTGMALKMLLSMLVLVLLIFLSPKEHVLAWAITFAVLYLAFLVFTTVRQSLALRRGRA